MPRKNDLLKFSISLAVIIMVLLFVGVVYALNTIDAGYQVNTGDTVTIDAWGICKKVTRNSGLAIFVPTKTSNEWQTFINHVPAETSLADCAAPFTCGTSTVTDTYNSVTKIYNTVQIGSQCWLKENIDKGTIVTLCQNGVPLPSGKSCKDPSIMSTLRYQNGGTIEKYCYDDDVTNCNNSGGIYQWAEAMQLPSSCNTTDCSASINSPHQGICPTGWHIPTDVEQHTLEMALKDGANSCLLDRSDPPNPFDCDAAGTKLKVGGISSFEGILNGYTTSPTYGDTTDGNFANIGNIGGFYSVSQNGDSEVWHRHLFSSSSMVYRHSGPKYYGDAIRCIKD